MVLDFSRYDTRHYRTVEVRAGYAGWSRTYDAQLDGNMDLFLLERLEGIEWSAVEYAIDLGCGTGRIGAWLASRGVAAIDGVDLTPEMLDKARDLGVYRRLLEEDVRKTSLPAAGADLVVSCLVVGHLPELGPAYDEADRLLRPGGHFVLVGYHPFFLLTGVPTHYHEEDGRAVAIRNHVHLMADHVDAGLSRGWVLGQLRERIVDEEWVGRNPSWSRHLHKPASFAMMWRKTTIV
jgi:SAM-dependent methyltransferase